MFCKECGNQLDPEKTVCPNCGTDNSVNEVTTSAEAAESAETAETAETAESAEQPVPTVPIRGRETKKDCRTNKKNRKALWITLAVILGVIVCLGIVGVVKADALKNFYYRTFANPAKYHNYVVEQYVDKFAEFYGNSFETNKKFQDAFKEDGINTSIKFGVYEEIQNLLGQITSMDLSWMDSAGIEIDSKTDDELVGVNLDLLVNDNSLVEMRGIGSIADNKGYYQFSTVSPYYLIMDYEEMLSLSGVDFTLKDIVSSYEIFSDVEAEQLSRMIREYTAVVLENIQTVEKTKDELTVGEFTVPCTKLDVVLSEKDLIKMQIALAEKFKEDEQLKKLVKDYCDYMDKLEGGSNPVDSTYDILMDSLDSWYDVNAGTEELKTDDPTAKYSLWIDKKSQIIGLRCYSLDNEEYDFELYNVEKKNTVATELLVSDAVKITGTAIKEDNLFNGSYTIAVEGQDAFLFDVKDFDLKALKDGYVNGTYQIKPTKELINELAPEMPSSLISDIGLEMAVAYNPDSYSMNAAIINGDVKWFSLDLMVTPSSEASFQIPSTADQLMEFDPDDQEDVFEYLRTCDFDSFISNLEKTKIPAEFVNAVKKQVEQLEMYLEYMDM